MHSDVIPLDLEFGWHAECVADAGLALGLGDSVPIGCRGSGHPLLLGYLAAQIRARPGLRVLDGGSGLGGPMAWLAREHGCHVVGVDLMEGAVRGARRLFPRSLVLVGSLTELPFTAGAFEAAWTVGSLSTVPDTQAAARELRRVLVPGGRLVVYDFVAVAAVPPEAPVANVFLRPRSLTARLGAAGLRVLASGAAPRVGPVPAAWREPVLAVEREVALRRGHDPRYRLAVAERAAFDRLRAAGQIAPWVLVLERPRA
ncbi:MAG TPA: class I SAM-dependent methyltransferase [Actinomycetes bacterium]|jgi:SAM-dependent methyltransferase|nr:class I SAM-dependent methyltransferase [Actinomycetes bacterium]